MVPIPPFTDYIPDYDRTVHTDVAPYRIETYVSRGRMVTLEYHTKPTVVIHTRTARPENSEMWAHHKATVDDVRAGLYGGLA